MRAALNALTDELKRLKSTGVTAVSVSPDSLAALRKVIAARAIKTVPQIPVVASRVAEAPESVGTRTVASSAPASSTRVEPVVVKPEVIRLLPPPPVVMLPAGDKATRWEWLKNYVLTHPVCAANVRPGKKVVLGVGSLDAKIMLVGEAPGAEEEVQGEPFVGPAGQLLTKMILAMGVKREDVYIGNIMNWRPQTETPEGVEQVGNRAPTTEEMAFCMPFLHAQIEIVNPDLIVALGSTAAQGLLGAGSFKSLGSVRGQWKEFSGKPVLISYHPSYLLRQESMGPAAARKAKRATWEDLLKVMERAGLPISDKQRGYFLEK
ncbi:MAG: uracil-DNA glycosylase [Opitutaceae bacterium]|jgi:DNA polymerase